MLYNKDTCRMHYSVYSIYTYGKHDIDSELDYWTALSMLGSGVSRIGGSGGSAWVHITLMYMYLYLSICICVYTTCHVTFVQILVMFAVWHAQYMHVPHFIMANTLATARVCVCVCTYIMYTLHTYMQCSCHVYRYSENRSLIIAYKSLIVEAAARLYDQIS